MSSLTGGCSDSAFMQKIDFWAAFLFYFFLAQCLVHDMKWLLLKTLNGKQKSKLTWG